MFFIFCRVLCWWWRRRGPGGLFGLLLLAAAQPGGCWIVCDSTATPQPGDCWIVGPRAAAVVQEVAEQILHARVGRVDTSNSVSCRLFLIVLSRRGGMF